jgi:integrase
VLPEFVVLSAMPEKTTKSIFKGREVRIKANGLPQGSGLFWLDSKRLYIYAKVQGERFSCGTNDWRVALDVIETQRAELEKREKGLVFADVRIGELLDDVVAHFEARGVMRGDYGTKTAYVARTTINMEGGVRDTFGKIKASKLVPADYTEYRLRWTANYVAKGKKADRVQNTIDHHLVHVRRAITLGIENRKVSKDTPLPKIDPKNSLAGAREGLITSDQAVALIETLPEWAAVAFAVCYSTSIRKKEATFIRRSETNLPMINLRASETKQGKARTHGVPDTVLPLVNLWEAKTKRDYPKAEFLLHRDGAQLTVKELTDAFEKACESLGWHVPVLDDKGLPIVYMGEKVKMDRSKIRWHDSRRSAITEVSSLLTLSSQEVQKGMGISHETQAKYSQNQNAPTLILAALNAKNAKAIDVVPAAPVAVHAGTDKRSKLTELKALFDDGLIDGDEYKESKKALLAA